MVLDVFVNFIKNPKLHLWFCCQAIGNSAEKSDYIHLDIFKYTITWTRVWRLSIEMAEFDFSVPNDSIYWSWWVSIYEDTWPHLPYMIAYLSFVFWNPCCLLYNLSLALLTIIAQALMDYWSRATRPIYAPGAYRCSDYKRRL